MPVLVECAQVDDVALAGRLIDADVRARERVVTLPHDEVVRPDEDEVTGADAAWPRRSSSTR